MHNDEDGFVYMAYSGENNMGKKDYMSHIICVCVCVSTLTRVLYTHIVL